MNQFKIYLVINEEAGILYKPDNNFSIMMPYVPRVGDYLLINGKTEEDWEDFLIERDVLNYRCCFGSDLLDFFDSEQKKYHKNQISKEDFRDRVKNYIRENDAIREDFDVGEFLIVEDVNYTHPDKCIYVGLGR